MALEDSLDRVARDLVVEALQRTADSRVAPRRVLVRHADHEDGDIRLGAGATGTRFVKPAYFLATSRLRRVLANQPAAGNLFDLFA